MKTARFRIAAAAFITILLLTGCSGGDSGTTSSSAASAPAPAATTYTLTTTVTGSGTLTSSPSGINCGATCSASFNSGTSVTLTAAPAAGYSFTGWSGACSGTATTCAVTMSAARSASATFTVIPTGSSSVTPSLVATRTTGYAPLAVHFDATGATSTTPGISDLAQGGSFRQIKHAFNFGDPGSGTHSITGLSKNAEPSGGGLAAHVFDTAGSYTVTVTSTDGIGAPASTTVTVTVSNPATLTTYAISKTGTFTGAPTGSIHLTQSTMPAFASNTRYFFNRGEDWSSADISIQDPLTNVHVDAYGSGANPLFNNVAVGTSRPQTATFATDIRVSNITSNTGFQQSNGGRVLFYKDIALRPVSSFSGSGAGYNAVDPFRNIPQSAFTNSYEVFWVDSQLYGDPAASGAFTSTDTNYAFYGNGSRLVFLNTRLGRTAFGTMRVTGWERGVMRHSRVDSPYSEPSVSALKLHSGGPNAYADNWLTSGGQNSTTLNYVNWTTSKVVIANTYFGGGDNGSAIANWTVTPCPQNDGYGAQGIEPLEDVILEGNMFIHQTGWASFNKDIAWGGRRITSRNNSVVQGSGALSVGGGHTQVPSYDGPYFTN